MNPARLAQYAALGTDDRYCYEAVTISRSFKIEFDIAFMRSTGLQENPMRVGFKIWLTDALTRQWLYRYRDAALFEWAPVLSNIFTI